MRREILWLFAVLSVVAARSSYATFHLMQIEQVIAGVNGNVTAQAIQLRMRSSFQNFIEPSRLRAWDAAGRKSLVSLLARADRAVEGEAQARTWTLRRRSVAAR